MRIETGLLAVFLALGQGVDGFQQHITVHRWLSKAAFAVDNRRHESSIPLVHVSGKRLQLLMSASSTIEGHDSESATMSESDPPFPDTSSLNEKLAELSQSNKESAAIEANNIIQKCESWYQDQVDCGVEILPCSQDFIPSMSEVGESGEKTRIGPVPDRHSYSFLINAWANIGRVDDAIATLERMHELSIEGERCTKPNTIAYNSVINAFCSRPEKMGRSGETDGISAPERAEGLLRQMIKDYYEGSNEFCFPDTTTYNTVLKVWASSGREDAGENAIRLLKEMWNEQSKFQKANSVDEEDPADKEESEEAEGGKILEITPDQYSYTTTISALARSGNSTAARYGESLLEEMEKRYQDGYLELSPTTYSVNAVLNAWGKIACQT
jgi:pentatricopeptide repeat protein